MEPRSRIVVIPDMASVMRIINLNAKVSEFGFFRSFATTRKRLIFSVIISSAIAYGLAFLGAYYVLEVSGSVGINLAIITALMMLLLVMSYLQAVLVGEFFFTENWRRRVVLGEKVDGALKDHNAEFLIVLVVFVLVNAFTLNLSTNGFFDTYHKEGFFRSELRSSDPLDRKNALVRMADITNVMLWEDGGLRTLVRQQYIDPDARVREQAAWNSGEMGDKSARKDLIKRLEDSSLDVRASAAIALGKLGNQTEVREAIEARLEKSKGPKERIAMLRGLALLNSPLSGLAAWKHTRDDDESVSLYAYWVVRNGAPNGIREKLRERLASKTSPKERCALLDTLKMVANEDDVSWSRRQFESVKKGEKCEPFVWEDRNERIYYVLYSDTFRVKHMKIVANASGTTQRSWFDRLIADTSQSWRVREVALEIVKQIDKAQKGRH